MASLKGKVQGVEEKSNEQQNSLRNIEKTLGKIENTVLSAQDEVLSKQSNEWEKRYLLDLLKTLTMSHLMYIVYHCMQSSE